MIKAYISAVAATISVAALGVAITMWASLGMAQKEIEAAVVRDKELADAVRDIPVIQNDIEHIKESIDKIARSIDELAKEHKKYDEKYHHTHRYNTNE